MFLLVIICCIILDRCSSYVGKVDILGQDITLSEACAVFTVIVHEVLHALGFFHEHTRPDRNLYVVINATNIVAGKILCSFSFFC